MSGSRKAARPGTGKPSNPDPVAGWGGAPLDGYAMEVERHVRRWLESFALAPDAGTRARIEKVHAGAAFATLFPRGDVEVHELAADIMVWITAVGDVLVDTGRRDFSRIALHLAETLHGTAAGSTGDASTADASTGDKFTADGGGFAAALADVVVRSERHLSPRHHLRVVKALAAFLLAQNWRVSAEAGEIPATVADYVTARRHTVGGWTLVALIEPLEGPRFSPRLGRETRLAALNTAVCNVLAWINDLASYRKEDRAAAAAITLPALVARERGCPVPESLEIVAGMRDAEIERARELADRLARDGAGEPSDYAALIKELIGHFSLWHGVLAADRYR